MDPEDNKQGASAGEPFTPKIPYPGLLRQVLHSLSLNQLLMEIPPTQTSPWLFPPEGPQGTAATTLASDETMLAERLEASRYPGHRRGLHVTHPCFGFLRTFILDCLNLHLWMTW